MLIFTLIIFIVFSGCVEEKNATQTNESVHQGSANLTPENLSSATLSSEAENIPEIEITSFSSIYKHDNREKVDEYLFSWDNVPGNESYKLSEYLRNDHDISLEGLARIVKSNDNKTISVIFPSGYSAELRLDDNKSNVLITRPDIPNVELKAKEVDNKLCIYKFETNYVRSKNITERYYAIYGLSIKNNGSKDLDFKLNELSVRNGDNIFNPTIEPYYRYSFVEVLSDLEKETKLKDATLSPGQTINGSVVFQFNSLYDKSFLLMYNETPITSASFEKSIEALSTVERYDYSKIFNIPPYTDGFNDSFEYSVFSNWVNRSIFEVFNKADIESFNKDVSFYMSDPSHSIERTELVYALEVIPATNITLLPLISNSFNANPLLVVDDTGKELINSSYTDDKIVILKNQTYELHTPENKDFPQIIDNQQMKLNFSNVTIVRISFLRDYSYYLFSRVNQTVIVDKELKVVVASNDCDNFFSKIL